MWCRRGDDGAGGVVGRCRRGDDGAGGVVGRCRHGVDGADLGMCWSR